MLGVGRLKKLAQRRRRGQERELLEPRRLTDEAHGEIPSCDAIYDMDEDLRALDSLETLAERVPVPLQPRQWPDVMFLQLSRWHLGPPVGSEAADAFLSDIARSLATVDQVSFVTVHDTRMTQEGLAAFIVRGVQTTQSVLMEIALPFCSLDDSHMHPLCQYLKSNPPLRFLDLNHNLIGKAGVTLLPPAMRQNSNLQRLSLHGNYIQCDGAIAMARVMETSRLVDINLNFCDIGENGLIKLASAMPRSSCLRVLHLDGNTMTPEVALAILDGVRCSNLTHLTMNFTKSYTTRAFYQKLKDLLHHNAVVGGLAAKSHKKVEMALEPRAPARRDAVSSQLEHTVQSEEAMRPSTHQPRLGKFRVFTTNEPSRALMSVASRASSVASSSLPSEASTGDR